LTRWREEAVERMAQIAQKRGANAVVGMRFDHREITSSWVEICAYGTAVVVSPVDHGVYAPRKSDISAISGSETP
jgi:uncharacterized protein YbjQ (UPF0145 family)